MKTDALRPGSLRSLAAACRIAGLSHPATPRDLGDVFLKLLIGGIDCVHVGRPFWRDAILNSAPAERTPRTL